MRPRYRDLSSYWDQLYDRQIPHRQTRHAVAQLRREVEPAANESSRFAEKFWPERQLKSAIEVSSLFLSHRHRLGPTGGRKPHSLRSKRQCQSKISIAP